MYPFHSHNSVAYTSEETFVERVSVGGEVRRIEFVRPITWLLSTESQLRFLHGGKVLKEGSSYVDLGYLTSMDAAIENAEEIALRHSISQNSSLELVVITEIAHRPCTQSKETVDYNRKHGANSAHKYLSIPGDWRQEEMSDGMLIFPSLKERVLFKGVSWTTKSSPASNLERTNALRTRRFESPYTYIDSD